MEMTMLEYLSKVGRLEGRKEGRKEGRQEGRREQLRNAVASLRKALRRRNVDPSPCEKRFAKFVRAGQVNRLRMPAARAAVGAASPCIPPHRALHGRAPSAGQDLLLTAGRIWAILYLGPRDRHV